MQSIKATNQLVWLFAWKKKLVWLFCFVLSFFSLALERGYQCCMSWERILIIMFILVCLLFFFNATFIFFQVITFILFLTNQASFTFVFIVTSNSTPSYCFFYGPLFSNVGLGHQVSTKKNVNDTKILNIQLYPQKMLSFQPFNLMIFLFKIC